MMGQLWALWGHQLGPVLAVEGRLLNGFDMSRGFQREEQGCRDAPSSSVCRTHIMDTCVEKLLFSHINFGSSGRAQSSSPTLGFSFHLLALAR